MRRTDVSPRPRLRMSPHDRRRPTFRTRPSTRTILTPRLRCSPGAFDPGTKPRTNSSLARPPPRQLGIPAISPRPCCTWTGRSTTQCCTASPIARHSTRGSTRQAGGGSPPRPNHFRSPDYESPRITGLETWFKLPHERRAGLDHLALDVVGVEALHSWETTLDASNVVRSPIVESPFGWHLNVRAPDNIAVELLAMKPEASAALCG